MTSNLYPIFNDLCLLHRYPELDYTHSSDALRVLLALAKPTFTASSKLLEEPAIISVTLATLSFSAIPIASFPSLYHSTNMIGNVKGLLVTDKTDDLF